MRNFICILGLCLTILSCSENDSDGSLNNASKNLNQQSTMRVGVKLEDLKDDLRFTELLTLLVEEREIADREKVKYFETNGLKNESDLGDLSIALGYSEAGDLKENIIKIDALVTDLDKDYGIRSLDQMVLGPIVDDAYDTILVVNGMTRVIV